jgi:hypothetical protein
MLMADKQMQADQKRQRADTIERGGGDSKSVCSTEDEGGPSRKVLFRDS